MDDYILSEFSKISIKYHADVVVAGGGIAGISAAIAAARSGASVILIEKQCMLGGLATSGLIDIFLPLCDGKGHQMSYGLAESLLKFSVRRCPVKLPDEAWLNHKEGEKKGRYEATFNPQYMALSIEQKLVSLGIHILYDSCISFVQCSGGRIDAVEIETAGGRIGVHGKTYVDATGDARLFWLAGADISSFSRGNILAAWYFYNDGNENKLEMHGWAEVFDERANNVELLSNRRYSGLDVNDISDYIISSHKEMLKDFLEKEEENPNISLSCIPAMPQFRMTRCIKAIYTLSDKDDKKEFDDSIGMIGDWRKSGPAYEIPFSSLVSDKLNNVISAGRCIGTNEDMWDISRVIPGCAVTGEAAGTAAALFQDVLNIDYKRLADELRKKGQRLTFDEIDGF